MIAAIAAIYGYSTESDQVRTAISLLLLGTATGRAASGAATQAATKWATVGIRRIPGRLFIEINKKVGFRLVTKAGTTGVVNMIRLVPVAGGIAGGTCDGAICYSVGLTAQRLFAAGEQIPPGTPATQAAA
jgi:uncharacterized protein (DUF697 family)